MNPKEIISKPMKSGNSRDPLTESLITESELKLLYSLMTGGKQDFTQTVLEIGTWRGGTARKLAANAYLNGKKFVTCDIKIYPEIKKALEPVKDIAVFYAEKSTDVIKRLENIWMCFIDGTHSFEHVRNEITALYPVLETGGCIALHDCKRVTGVDRAIDWYLKQYPEHFKEINSPCEIIRILKKENAE